MSQLLFEHSITGKLEGATAMMEAEILDTPNALIDCYNAVKLDA